MQKVKSVSSLFMIIFFFSIVSVNAGEDPIELGRGTRTGAFSTPIIIMPGASGPAEGAGTNFAGMNQEQRDGFIALQRGLAEAQYAAQIQYIKDLKELNKEERSWRNTAKKTIGSVVEVVVTIGKIAPAAAGIYALVKLLQKDWRPTDTLKGNNSLVFLANKDQLIDSLAAKLKAIPKDDPRYAKLQEKLIALLESQADELLKTSAVQEVDETNLLKALQA